MADGSDATTGTPWYGWSRHIIMISREAYPTGVIGASAMVKKGEFEIEVPTVALSVICNSGNPARAHPHASGNVPWWVKWIKGMEESQGV